MKLMQDTPSIWNRMIRFNEHWLSKPKGEPRRGWLARCSLIGIALCLANISGFEKAHSVSWSIPKLKQYTFHQLNYSFDDFYCVDELWYKESRWDYKAKNPKSSAFGIPQILGLKEKNPLKQIDIGLAYIEYRYDNPCNALAHHKKKGWY